MNLRRLQNLGGFKGGIEEFKVVVQKEFDYLYKNLSVQPASDDDGGGTTTIIQTVSDPRATNWDAAYAHSLITSGNPHQVALNEVLNPYSGRSFDIAHELSFDLLSGGSFQIKSGGGYAELMLVNDGATASDFDQISFIHGLTTYAKIYTVEGHLNLETTYGDVYVRTNGGLLARFTNGGQISINVAPVADTKFTVGLNTSYSGLGNLWGSQFYLTRTAQHLGNFDNNVFMDYNVAYTGGTHGADSYNLWVDTNVNVGGSPTDTHAYKNIYSSITTAGTVNSVRAVEIAMSIGGTVATAYGLYIGPISGATSNYAVYMKGTSTGYAFLVPHNTAPKLGINITAAQMAVDDLAWVGLDLIGHFRVRNASNGIGVSANANIDTPNQWMVGWGFNLHATADGSGNYQIPSDGANISRGGGVFYHAYQSTATLRGTIRFFQVPNSGSVTRNVTYANLQQYETLRIYEGGTVFVGPVHADTPVISAASLQVYASGGAYIIARNATADIEVAIGSDTLATFVGAMTAHALQLRTNNTTYVTISSTGMVGIGTTPESVSRLFVHYPDDGSGGKSIRGDATAVLTGAKGGNFTYAGYFDVYKDGSFDYSGGIVGVYGRARNEAAGGTTAYTIGLWSQVYSNDTGIVTEANGLRIQIYHTSTGTITNAYGLYVHRITKDTGAISLAIGAFISTISAVDVYGVRVAGLAGTGGNMGLYVEAISAAASGSNYGIYVGAVSGASTNYAIYAAGGKSYHAGHMGIGDSLPSTSSVVYVHKISGSSTVRRAVSALYVTPSGEDGYFSYAISGETIRYSGSVAGYESVGVLGVVTLDPQDRDKNRSWADSGVLALAYSAPTAGYKVVGIAGLVALARNQGTSGVTDNVYGVVAITDNNSVTNTGNAYGLFVRSMVDYSSGTVGNKFGLYIESISGGTGSNYAIYAAGGQVYFASTTTIGASLYVTSNIVTYESTYLRDDDAAAWHFISAGTGTNYYNAGILIRHDSTHRWGIYKSADAAANLLFARYNDAGAWQGEALYIFRSNGYIGTEANLGVGGSPQASYLLYVYGDSRIIKSGTTTLIVGGVGAADNGIIQITGNDTVFGYLGTLQAPTLTNPRAWTFPDVTGTVYTTGNPPALNDIANPTGNKTFSMTTRQLTFLWVNPSGNPMELEASGAYTGALLHIHQHTGNPGAAYLLTLESTDTDIEHIGSTMPGADNHVLCAYVSGDTQERFVLHAGGRLEWGPGGSTAADTNLYRSAANNLKTDDNLYIAESLYIGTATVVAGAVYLYDSDIYSYKITVSSAGALTGNRTYELPWFVGSGTKTLAVTEGSTFGTGSVWNGGTIGTAYGGTNLTSFTANGLLYASSTSVLATTSNISIDGSKFTKYNNTALEALGVPSIIDFVDNGTDAAIAATNCSNSTATGVYRMSVHLMGTESDSNATYTILLLFKDSLGNTITETLASVQTTNTGTAAGNETAHYTMKHYGVGSDSVKWQITKSGGSSLDTINYVVVLERIN